MLCAIYEIFAMVVVQLCQMQKGSVGENSLFGKLKLKGHCTSCWATHWCLSRTFSLLWAETVKKGSATSACDSHGNNPWETQPEWLKWSKWMSQSSFNALAVNSSNTLYNLRGWSQTTHCLGFCICINLAWISATECGIRMSKCKACSCPLYYWCVDCKLL